MNNLKDIHNIMISLPFSSMLFYQDFNEQFEGYTQPLALLKLVHSSCFIRISMNNLKDIHNTWHHTLLYPLLFYQDFNEQFEGYTQLHQPRPTPRVCCFIRISMNNLKDIHNRQRCWEKDALLFYQDFNEQFEGYTQLISVTNSSKVGCFIRISMNNSKNIQYALFIMSY